MALKTDNIAIERDGIHYKLPLCEVVSLFPINNTLTSTSSEEALSAAQGRVLGNRIEFIDPVAGTIVFPYSDLNPTGIVVGGIPYINPQLSNLSIPSPLTPANMLASGFIPSSDVAVEIYSQHGPLSGLAQGNAKLGIDTLNGNFYHPVAGLWSLLPTRNFYTSSGGIKIDALNISIDISTLQTA